MPAISLFMRHDASTPAPSPVNRIYVVGFCIIGVLGLGLLVWILVRLYRKRAIVGETHWSTRFQSNRGLVQESEQDLEKGHSPETVTAQGNTFSRERINSSVVFPDRALSRPSQIREDIPEPHRQTGTFPRSLNPFSFALAAGSHTPTSSSAEGTSLDRSSFMSGLDNHNRFSAMSTNSSINSGAASGAARKVRQTFDPALPDELLLCRLGEQLTVVHSFDDGWCLVRRENGMFASVAKSLFKANVPPEGVAELGVVPAWCFLKPVSGVKTGRPVRNISLGISAEINKPGFSSRDEIRSWSNF